MEFITSSGAPAGAVGQGTWYLGEHPDTLQRECGAIRAGVEAGMTLIDTAEMYGEGAAEELVVQLLLMDTSLAAHCGELAPEQFCSPFLSRVYAAALAAHGEGRSLTLAALAGECTQEEMAFLTTLLQRPASMANAERALGDYIKVIRASAARREGQEPDDPLLAAMDRSKEKKGQWRKAK